MLIKRNIPGYDLKFDIREEASSGITASDKIVIDEMFNENVYDIHDGTFEDNKIMIDIGANIGATSILGYTKGATCIFAYEPEKHNYEQLLKNIKLNKLEHAITPIKKAVANVIGTSEIFDGQGASFITGARNVSVALEAAISQEREIIPTTTLDDILSEFNEIALLKIDCEGGEYKIIEGAALETLKKCKRIVMEYHCTDDVTFGKMVAKLSLVFNTRIFGDYINNGGQIDAMRY